MNTNALGWFEIYVNDMARARAFYEAVFDVQLTRIAGDDGGFQMWAFPSFDGGPGAPGAIAHMPGLQAGGNSTLAYFNCADCAVQAARAAAHGGSIFKPKFAIGARGFVALAVDSEGNMFGLYSKA